jgi:ABC-type phosphonate transport system ATPase subunit
MTLAIEAVGLVKRFGKTLAVDGVDLAVRPGMVLGLLGPNGAGKTTVVRMLATLLRPDAGHALSRGQHAELTAIGIGHGHPADLALAGVDAGRPEVGQTAGLPLLITVNGRSKIETQPALSGLRHHSLSVPGDLRTAPRRADRGLEALIPDQRPA